MAQILSHEELHHDVRCARLEPADVVHLGDVIAPEPGSRATLAKKALHRLRVREIRRMHEFDRSPLLQIDVHRRDNDAHPARTKDALDPIFPGEHVPRLHRRVWQAAHASTTSAGHSITRRTWSSL